MKKQVLLFAMMLLPMVTNAESVEVDGIYYNLIPKAKKAEVTSKPSGEGKYVGDIVIPDSIVFEGEYYLVTAIGKNAIQQCKDLTSVFIPKTITTIANVAFAGAGLTAIKISDINAWLNIPFTFENNPLIYAHHLYLNDEEIKDLILPNDVSKIGDYAFSGCKSFTALTISENVESIGEGAFYGCLNLSSVTIKEGVNSLGEKAFGNCENLETIHLPTTISIIPHSLFSDCSSLKEITLPNNVKEIGISAFRNCTNLQYVVIPESVISIGEYAFYGCTHLQSAIVKKGVITIGEYAFSNCSELSSISLPNSIETINNNTFQGCSKLSSINQPDEIKHIGNGAFKNCISLESLTIPPGVNTIEKELFSGCSSLKSIAIPDGVLSIAEKAFEKCKRLSSVILGNSVSYIGNYAFYDCPEIRTMIIPNSVGGIGKYAFGCEKMTSITIGSGLKNIGDYAFSGCMKLDSIHIVDIGSWCDVSCGLYFASSPFYYAHHLFHNGDEIKDLIIPTGVTQINTWAFKGCSSIQSVSIPNSVTYIGRSAFEGCDNLETIKLGEGITTFGDYAFKSCKNIKDVYCYGKPANKSGYEMFNNSYIEYATLHVPSSLIEDYQQRSPWNKFGEIITLTDDDTTNAKQIEANAVLIQSENRVITISGASDNTRISVFGTDGLQIGSAVIRSGQAVINTNLHSGSIAIVKIGNRSVKVAMK